MSIHLLCHAGCHGCAVPILDGPHTVQVKESHPVAVLESMVEIRLKVGHSTEVSINKAKASLLGGQSERLQKITNLASGGQIHMQVGMVLTSRVTAVARQWTVEPDINRDRIH